MAGRMRFDSLSASSEESNFMANYSNAQRGNCRSSTLDRSGSAMAAEDLPPLPKCLRLDPISMGNQKCTRSGELKRAFGYSFGSPTGNSSLGSAHTKAPLAVVTEDIKRVKASVLDGSEKARSRTKTLGESLHKLTKYTEALSSKKQQNDILTNERADGPNIRKPIQQNSTDFASQRLEDRTKNAIMNRRAHSSVAEIQAEGRISTFGRQALFIGKDRDMLRDSDEGSDFVEEKLRRLPSGGELRDKKMKRKRSAGTILTRLVDSGGDMKRVMHHKLIKESGLQYYDNQSVGLSIREDNHFMPPSQVKKERGYRAPRTGTTTVVNGSPKFSRTPGTLESLDHSVNEVPLSRVNYQKHPMPTGSSSPSMAQWVVQRPPKHSRTKRTNLVSPVPNHEKLQIPSEGFSASDLGTRIASVGDNESIIARSVSRGNRKPRMKHGNVLSPGRVSEHVESGACKNHESRVKEKLIGSDVEERVLVQDIGPSGLPTTENKMTIKEDGVRRQGRSNRGSSISRVSIFPLREELENSGSAKPNRTSKHRSDKNGSKSGCPPKKLIDRKAFSCLGQTANRSSLDAGEDDDREELLTAATFASNARYHACSSSFWKRMEPIIASVSLDDMSYLKQQLRSTEELQENLAQMHGPDNADLGDTVHEENLEHRVHKTREWSVLDQIGSKELAQTVDLLDQFQDIGTFGGESDSGRRNNTIPLYQRVLSAFIVEDDNEELQQISGGREMASQYSANLSDIGVFPIDVDPNNMTDANCEDEFVLGLRRKRRRPFDSFPCNDSTVDNGSRIRNKLCKGELFHKYNGFSSSEIGIFSNHSGYSLHGPEAPRTNAFGNLYSQMSLEDKLLLELQSVGIYPDILPDLADGEDVSIDKDILEIQKTFCQQVGKKEHLKNLMKAIEADKEMEKRGLEQVAMDKLVVSAYEKQLATRGSIASKSGIPKVPKQVAATFTCRTLARCRKFEDTGKSCFTEPALRDVLFPAPCCNDTEFKDSIESAVDTNLSSEMHNSQPGSSSEGLQDLHNNKTDMGSINGLPCHLSEQEASKSGPLQNRGRRRELLLDDVGGSSSFRSPSTLGNPLPHGAKGKRSERNRDPSARNYVAKAGRTSAGNSKGEPKTRSKPKQKTAQLSTSGNGLNNKIAESDSECPISGDGINRKRDARPMSNSDVPQSPQKETKEPTDILSEIGVMDDVGNDLEGHQDLGSWLNIDDDDLQDIFTQGLEIPMDDLSEVL